VSASQPRSNAAYVFEVVEYDPGTHGAFVRSTWAHGALRSGSREARARLDALLGLPGSRAVLAHLRGSQDDYAGWAARTSEALIFAYVLPVLRRRGLGTRLVREVLGFGAGEVPLLQWTPSAQRLAAHGRPVYHALFDL